MKQLLVDLPRSGTSRGVYGCMFFGWPVWKGLYGDGISLGGVKAVSVLRLFKFRLSRFSIVMS
jgi:hypothetical protein